jgi:hypothetical protein
MLKAKDRSNKETKYGLNCDSSICVTVEKGIRQYNKNFDYCFSCSIFGSL